MIEIIGLLGMFTVAFLASLTATAFVWAALHVRAHRAGVVPAADSIELPPAALFKGEGLSTISVWGSVLARFSHIDTLRARIAEASLEWSAGRVTAAMLLLATITFVLALQFSWMPPMLLGMLPVLAGGIPYFYVLHRRSSRFGVFAKQFPDALDSLARALKSGFPLSAGFEMLALEYPEPLASEMRRTREEWKLGVSWDNALDNLCGRLPIPEVRLFAAAVKMQNRMGGKLNDVLSRLAETMRDGVALDSEVRSISAHSRITGMVLTVMPIAIGLLMLFVSPQYVSLLFTTPEGRIALSLVAVANVAAHLLIRKIVRIRY
jgi:tight adherence protein B